jgi:anti-sigma-K factor RskA
VSFDDHNPRECADDAAAFVLGAMDLAEAAEYRRHLSGCVVCADDVAAFRLVTGALPLAAPQHPVPAGLRRRVVRSVHAERRADRRANRGAGAKPQPLRTRAAFALAALAVTIAVAVALLSGPGAGPRLIQARVMASGASAQLRVAGGRAELIVHHLPAPPAGSIYEVWLKRPGAVPAPTTTLFSVSADGSADVGVPSQLTDVRDILVTVERAGGSRVSTHRPVIVAPTT